MVGYNKKNNELLYEYLVNHNKEVYDELYLNNLGLINHCIRKYICVDNELTQDIFDEYFSVGCIALHNAINTFDVNKIGVISFSTYAESCIRNGIFNEIKNSKTSIKASISLDDPLYIDEESSILVGNTIIDPDNNIEDYIEEEYFFYKKEKVKTALSKLSERDRSLIEDYYGLNGKERLSNAKLSQKYQISYARLNVVISDANMMLAKELEEFKGDYRKSVVRNEDDLRKNTQYKKLQELYSKYGKDKVLYAVDRLSKKEKVIFSMRYGLNGYQMMTMKEISLQTQLKLSQITTIIKKIMNKVIVMLENPEKIVENNKVEELFVKYGKEKVLNVINKLKQRNRDIISMRFGINGYEVTSVKEISDIYKIDSTYISKQIWEDLKYVVEILDEVQLDKNRIEELYSKYGKERVLKEIELLDELDKKIINMRYGLENEECMSLREIKENVHLSTTAISKRIDKSLEQLEKSLEGTPIVSKNNKLYPLIEKYGKDKVIEAIGRLSKSNREIICMRYEIETGKVVPLKEIAKKYNKSVTAIGEIIYNSLNKVINMLEHPEIEVQVVPRKIEILRELIEKYGKDKVLEMVSKLNKEYRDIITWRYGLDGKKPKTYKEISSITNLSTSVIMKRIEISLDKVKGMLDTKQKKKLIK